MSAGNEILIRLGVNGQAQVIGAFNQLAGAAGRLRAVLAGLAGLAGVGALAEFTRRAINTADEMGKLAQKTGILTEELSGLAYAAKLGDLDQKELATALKFLGQEMAETGKQAQSLDTRVMELADQFAAMPDGVEKNEIALKNFGKAGLEMIPFLNQGSEAIRKQREEAARFGLIISGQFGKNADEFNDNLDRMKAIVQGLFLQLAEKLLPSLIKLQEKFIEFFGNIQTRQAIVNFLAEAFKRTAIFAVSLAYAYEQLVNVAEAAFLSFMTDGGTAVDEFLEQSAKAGERYDALLRTLKSINEEQDDLAQTTNNTTSAFVTLGSRMDSLKSWLAQERAGADIREGKGGFFGADQAKVRRGDLEAQLALLEKMKTALGPDPEIGADGKRMVGLASDEGLVRSQKVIEYQQKLIPILKEQAAVNAELAQIEQRRYRAQEKYAEGYSTFFGNLAATAKAFGKKAFIAWKAFAIAQGIVDTYKAAISAFASGTAIGTPALGAAFAAAAVTAGLANVAVIAGTNPQGYAAGGYTGSGPRYEIAGPAHRGEFVFSAPRTNALGVGFLDALHRGDVAPVAASGAAPTILNAFVVGESELRGLLRSRAGRDEIINIVRASKMEIGIRS